MLQPPDCHPPPGGAADLAQEAGQARGQAQGGAGQQAPAPAPATERLLKVKSYESIKKNKNKKILLLSYCSPQFLKFANLYLKVGYVLGGFQVEFFNADIFPSCYIFTMCALELFWTFMD